jgi:hypothetical protein
MKNPAGAIRRGSFFTRSVLSALTAVHRILGATGRRIYVSRSASNRIARGYRQGSADQQHRENLVNHCRSSIQAQEQQ